MLLSHAICNEAHAKWPFAEACQAICKACYTDIESAPFTLAPTPADLTAGHRAEYRTAIAECLTFVKVHWLMVSSKGLNVTPPTPSSARAAVSTRDLIDLCALAVAQTFAEAVGIVQEINSPAIRTFDVHNAVDEHEPCHLVDRYFEFIEHVHVNELDGGAVDYDFKPVLAMLERRQRDPAPS